MPMTRTPVPEDRRASGNEFLLAASGWAGDVEVRYWESRCGDTSRHAAAAGGPAGRAFDQLLSLDYHVLSIPLRDVAHQTLERDGRHLLDGPCGKGTVSVLPAGTRWGLRWRGPSDFVNFRIPVRGLALDGLEEPLDLAPVVAESDPVLAAIAEQIAGEIRNVGVIDCTYLYALANAAVFHAVRRFGVLSRKGEAAIAAPHRPLGRRSAAEIACFIESHLGRRLPLTLLAAQAGISPYHFARAFKEAFGMPPHTYVTQRRVERATDMLRNRPDVTLTDVALATGFATPSHFATVFRRVAGRSPSAVRAQALGQAFVIEESARTG